MRNHARINEISDYLTTAGVPHTVYPARPDINEDDEGSLSFRPQDSDWDDLLEWHPGHGWTLSSQQEPSPIATVALPVQWPAAAFHVASAVIAVYTGAVDESKTISYGDIRYA